LFIEIFLAENHDKQHRNYLNNLKEGVIIIKHNLEKEPPCGPLIDSKSLSKLDVLLKNDALTTILGLEFEDQKSDPHVNLE
jgi:hypothetical protein